MQGKSYGTDQYCENKNGTASAPIVKFNLIWKKKQGVFPFFPLR